MSSLTEVPRCCMAPFPPKPSTSATVAGLRYVRHSPGIKALTVRAGIVMFFASAILALLPSVAQHVANSSLGTAFYSAVSVPVPSSARCSCSVCAARWSTDVVVSTAVAILGVSVALTGTVRALGGLGVLMVVAGAAWLTFISLFSALVQGMAPDWVRARVLAVFMFVFQGGLAAGSALWGLVGERAGVQDALTLAGLSCIAIGALSYRWRLPQGTCRRQSLEPLENAGRHRGFGACRR